MQGKLIGGVVSILIYEQLKFSTECLNFDLHFDDWFTMITEDTKIDGISLFDYLQKLKQDSSYDKLQFFNLCSEDFDSIYHYREN